MRALGVHTYFGGFQIGLEPLVDVIGSFESWPNGIRGRVMAGVRGTLSFDDPVPHADLVFSNPPCSRFSTTAVNTFSEEEKRDIENFDELDQVIRFAYEARARVIWWETGPLCWRSGQDMIRSVHEKLKREWEEVTTFSLKYDTRYGGVPQRRPRTHVVHFQGARTPSHAIPEPTWPLGQGIWEWIGDRVPSQDGPEVRPRNVYGSPVKTVQTIRLIASYMASTPRLVHDDDPYALTVLTGRPFVWADHDRWWTIDEYAALMTFPLEIPRVVAEKKDPREALKLMSKGVAPAAAAFVYEHVVRPIANGETGDTAYEEWDDGMWETSLVVPDGPSRRDRLDPTGVR